jgi:hypothetical protein
MASRWAIAIAVLAGSVLDGACAQNDPWCAYLTGSSPNCAFATFADCIKAIQGKTGICDRNSEYAAPAQANSATPPAAAQPPAATGATAHEAGDVRRHRSHRGAHHLRNRNVKERSGGRHRSTSHRNRRR